MGRNGKELIAYGLLLMVIPELSESAKAAIIWFDLFDHPLTLLELEGWRVHIPNEIRILRNTNENSICNSFNSYFVSYQGFYCLKGREHIIQTRLGRAALAHQKFKKARRVAWLFAHIPFARMIAISNTLGYNNAREESDIDFFIVAEEAHIFFVRFVTTFFAKLFHWRSTKAHKKDTVCLSFYVSTDYLSLKKLRQPTLSEWPQDIYLHFWVNQLAVLYDERGYYQKFLSANTWVRELLPYMVSPVVMARRTIRLKWVEAALKSIGEFVLQGILGRILEVFLEHFQTRHLPINLKKQIGNGTGVMVNSKVLKFHDNDKRVWFQNEFLKRYEQITVSH